MTLNFVAVLLQDLRTGYAYAVCQTAYGAGPLSVCFSPHPHILCVCVFAPTLLSAAALQELLLHAAAQLLLCVGARNQSSQKKTVPGTQGSGLSAVHVLPVPWAVGWPLAGWIQGPCTAASTGLALRFAVLYVDVVVGARPSPGVACGEPLSLAANWVWLELLGVSGLVWQVCASVLKVFVVFSFIKPLSNSCTGTHTQNQI